jgi:hypothetical protein
LQRPKRAVAPVAFDDLAKFVGGWVGHVSCFAFLFGLLY